MNRRCSSLGIHPKPSGPNKPIQYRLTPAQLEALKKPLGKTSSSLGGSDLRQSKLAEEVEFLRLKNKRLRCETTSNRVVSQIIAELTSSTFALIRQKLEIEYPVQFAGLPEDEIRTHAHALVQEIASKWNSEAAKWEQYAESSGEANLAHE